MKLTAKAVSAAKFVDRPLKLSDGHGLYLHVTRTSSTWRYRYRLHGKAREFTIGKLDIVSLAEARERHRDARALVQDGVDPVAQRADIKAEKAAAEQRSSEQAVTVADLISDWLTSKDDEWQRSHTSKVQLRLRKLPKSFTGLPVYKVQAEDVVAVLEPIVANGRKETAHRVRSYFTAMFDRAAARKLIHSNPSNDPLVKELIGKRPRAKSFAHIKSVDLFSRVLVDIEHYLGNLEVRAALRLLPMLFVRPTELRGMRWSELHLEQGEWHIPAMRMKKGLAHVVPLPRQAVEILNTQRERVPDSCDLVFRGREGTGKEISNMTLNVALRRLGYGSDVIVPHGFRHTASTFLNDGKVTDPAGNSLTFRGDVIERQLAHVQGGARASYNKATYLVERTVMMQAWCDWLDHLKSCRDC